MTELRITQDFLIEVSKGNVPGHSIGFKFGRNDNLASGAQATIWNGGGLYTGFNPTVADTIDVYSNSAADIGALVNSGTATGGTTTTMTVSDTTGAAVGDMLINDTSGAYGIITSLTATEFTVAAFNFNGIPVTGDVYRVANATSTGSPVVLLPKLLDGNWMPQFEYLILNGTTPVTTTGTYLRCSRGRTYVQNNAGIITAEASATPADIFMAMPAGDNSSVISADTIPMGYTGFIIQWYASIAGIVSGTARTIDFHFYVRLVNDVFQLQAEASAFSTGSSYLPENFVAPLGPIPQMSDIRIDGISSANMSGVAKWTMLFIDNDYM